MGGHKVVPVPCKVPPNTSKWCIWMYLVVPCKVFFEYRLWRFGIMIMNAHKGCLFEIIVLAKGLFVNYVQWPVMCKLDYSPLCIERGRCRWGWAAPLLLLAAQQSHASNHPSFKTSLCHEIKCFGKPTTKLDLNLFKCADSYLLFLNCLTLCKVVYGWFGFPPCGEVGESWGWRAKATFVLLLPLRSVLLSIFAPLTSGRGI